MAQTPATFRQEGDHLDYTPGSATLAGTIVLLGNNVTINPRDLAANEKGAVTQSKVWNVPKDASDVSAYDNLYWNPTGDPVGGTAGSGAFTKNSTGYFAGVALEAAGTGVGDVDMFLVPLGTGSGTGVGGGVSTYAATGTAIGNATAINSTGLVLVTAADDTAAVKLPEAAAGKQVTIKNMVANKILKVFPAVNDSINAGAANAVYNQTNGALRTYYAYNSTLWVTDPEVIV